MNSCAAHRCAPATPSVDIMPRYKILIEYDGTPFAGWQLQADAVTVQGEIEIAIEKLTGENVTIQGAGRTDAGVHALGQVAHFDLVKPAETDTIRDGLNAHLRPHPIAILAAESVPDDFNARMSADQAALSLSHRQPAGGSRARPPARLARCRAGSTNAPCTRPRSGSSAITISRPSARPNARPSRRCARSTGSM